MNCKLMEETVGQRIKAQRIRLCMTQEELAVDMRIPKSTISAYENDKVDIKGSVLVELSQHLSTTPNYLLGYGEENDKDPVLESVATIFNGIKDEKIKELLLLQIQAAGTIMK